MVILNQDIDTYEEMRVINVEILRSLIFLMSTFVWVVIWFGFGGLSQAVLGVWKKRSGWLLRIGGLPRFDVPTKDPII